MSDSKKDGRPGTSRNNPAARGGGAINPAAAGPDATSPRPTVEAGVMVRRERFMVAARQLPGIQPMAADAIANTLTNMPDVTIVRRVRPRGFGALAAGGPTGITPEIIVAEMDPARGAALRASAPPHVVVEPDALLRHADGLAITSFDNAMKCCPALASTSGCASWEPADGRCRRPPSTLMGRDFRRRARPTTREK